MSKRANDQGEERAAKQVRQATDGQPAHKAEDEDMGEFEDQWGDEEESDGEVIDHDVAEDDDVNGDEDSESSRQLTSSSHMLLIERCSTRSGDDWRDRG
jgi:hypothetical protein